MKVEHKQLANALILSIDAVEAANSGHPGMPREWQTSQQSYLRIF